MPAAIYPTVVRTARAQARKARLKKLGYRDYATYLHSAAWMDTRRRYFGSDQPQDCICGATHELQLHHLTYERVGEEELADLTPLCPHCHVMIHELERRGEVGLDFKGFVNEERARLHREAAARQRAKRLEGEAEMHFERNVDRAIGRIKSNFDQIRGAARHCMQNGIDVDGELQRLDALAEAFTAKRPSA